MKSRSRPCWIATTDAWFELACRSDQQTGEPETLDAIGTRLGLTRVAARRASRGW